MRVLASIVLLSFVLGACGSDAPETDGAAHQPTVIRVPADEPTIAAAVAAAGRGDLILLSPGTYREAVEVKVPGIVIRGLSRSGVVLDGGGKLDNGFRVTADGVAIENLTVRDYTVNGILFTGSRPDGSSVYETDLRTLQGYRASYVTAVGNGLYGLYAFASRGGLFEHVYASGSPDSGIYIGQCKPCDAVVRDAVAEYNAIGFEGTNAGGDLYVVESVWRHNRVGITSNSEDTEELAPQVGAVFAGNLVADNDDPAAPPVVDGGFGLGIAVGGGTENRLLRNLVTGHAAAGIVITDLGPYLPASNEVRSNVLDANAVDLVFGWQSGEADASGNCFADNTFETSRPDDIETLLSCSSKQPAKVAQLRIPAGPGASDAAIPDPPADLAEMPAAATAAARPAAASVPRVDVDAIRVPSGR